MGTLERMRQISPYAIAFFAVALVALFTVFDPTVLEGLRGCGNEVRMNDIAIVNDEPLLYTEFEERLKQSLDMQKQQMMQQGQKVEESQLRKQLAPMIWDQYVEEVLVKQEAKKYGIVISKEQVIDQMVDNPPDFLKKSFTDSLGNFNRQRYLEIITNPEKAIGDPSKMTLEERTTLVNQVRQYLIQVEQQILRTRLFQETIQAVNASNGVISPLFAERSFKNDQSNANVRFVGVNIREIPTADIKISDSELKAYYDKYKEKFKQKESRKVKYVIIPMQPSADDSAAANTKIRTIVETLNNAPDDSTRANIFSSKLMGEYDGRTYDYQLVNDLDPEVLPYLVTLETGKIAGPVGKSDGTFFYKVENRREGENVVVKASHILVNFDENKDSAKAEANKILKRVKGGEDFATLARELSKDPGSGQQGGDLGWFGKGKMVPEFETAAFAAAKGEIVGPVETQFGYHIIKVDDKSSSEISYSEVKIEIYLSDLTKNQILADAQNFSVQVREGKNFDTLAKKLNLRASETGFIERNKSVLGSRQIADKAFEESVGYVSDPRENQRLGLIVWQVAEARQAGIMSFEDAKKDITAKLTKIKQLDMAKNKANELYNQVKNAGTLEALMLNDPNWASKVQSIPDMKNNASVPNVGNDAAFAEHVFNLPVNKINEPVRCENGYFIIEVVNRTTPDENKIKSELPEFKKVLYNNAKNSAYSQWMQHLKDIAKIDKNPRIFYSALTEE